MTDSWTGIVFVRNIRDVRDETILQVYRSPTKG